MEFLFVAFAAFAAWSFLRTLLPAAITRSRYAPVLVGGIAYGLTLLTGPALIALAATGAVALLCHLTASAEIPAPPDIRKLVRSLEYTGPRPRRKTPGKDETTGQGYRPSGQVGRRIPRL